MITAMQELIERLKKNIEEMPNEKNQFTQGYKAGLSFVIECATNSLEKEKEQIVFAHTNGHNDCYLYHFLKNSANEVGVRSGEEYYNQTYIQKEEQKQHIIDIMKADENDGLYNQNQ